MEQNVGKYEKLINLIKNDSSVEDAEFGTISSAPFFVIVSMSSEINRDCVGMITGMLLYSLLNSGIWSYLYLPSKDCADQICTKVNTSTSQIHYILCCGYPSNSSLVQKHIPPKFDDIIRTN